MIEYSKVRKKFGWNDISPYIEISKPKLRNNLNQLFAMKNSILILCLLFAGVTFGQDFIKGQTFESFDLSVDSMVIYKVSDVVYDNVLRIVRSKKFMKHELLDGAKVVKEVNDNEVTNLFTSRGVYAIQCFEDGVALVPSFLHVDDRYINSSHKTLKVGHRKHSYYYIQ